MRRDEGRMAENVKGSSQVMRGEQSETEGAGTAGEHRSKIRGMGKKRRRKDN